MKDAAAKAHPSGVLRTSAPIDVRGIHNEHSEFVWASLARLGVRRADLPDMLQEVFVVVHRRLDSFDGTSKMSTWLFGICVRVAAAYRRRAWFRRERPADPAFDEPSDSASPEEHVDAMQARQQLDALLDELSLERRVVFVLFELEEMPCNEIAELVGVPIGTVYSRVHAAREDLKKVVARQRAKGGVR